MDKQQITKYVMLGVGALLTIGANIVNAKNNDAKMKEVVAEKVAEALANQTKES